MTKQFEKLTDSRWEQISQFLDIHRKRKLNLRDVVDAIFYILRTGCQWRNLPKEYPNWRAVNYYFEQWKRDDTFEQINISLNQKDRIREGTEAEPSLLCIDSQSIKLSPMLFEGRGLDAGKKVNGRKRQILVDTGGRIWAVLVHGPERLIGNGANLHDGIQGRAMLYSLSQLSKRLKKILADGSYQGKFAELVRKNKLQFEVSSRPETEKGFVPLKQRWVVERTFAWTNFFRRVTKDYERTVLSSASWLLLMNIVIMTQRIPEQIQI